MMHNAHAFILYIFCLNIIGLIFTVIGCAVGKTTAGSAIVILFEAFAIAWAAILLWG